MCTNHGLLKAQKNTSIQNLFFRITADKSTGTIQVERANKALLISGAKCNIHLESEKKVLTIQPGKLKISTSTFTSELGPGQKIILTFHEDADLLKIQWEISLFDLLPAITFETKCTNESDKSLQIKSMEPLSIMAATTGSFIWLKAQKCLTNGAMYYDAGMIHTFGNPYQKPEPYGETKGGVMLNDLYKIDSQTVQSWWNIGIFSGYDQEGISVGYIENKTSLGRVQLLKRPDTSFSLVAESVFNPRMELKPGQTISSDRFMINIADNPYLALEAYANAMAKVGNARIGEIVNGWCNWFYTLDHFSEEEILNNATFAAKHLKPYGLEYIQIDEGFQTWHGEWEGNNRFPHGLKFLADQIKELGLKPGIWIAPFVVSDTTALFKNHPEWFLKTPDGTLKRIGPWPNEDTDWFRNESPKRYGLDITHPGAEKWFTDLIDTIANSWGFEMIKIDFVAWTVFSASQFYDAAATPAQVYAKALAIMRKTAGEKCHLLECGPGNVSIGSINSMRIEYDQNYGYFNEVWKQYFLGTSSSAGAAGKRYFYHNRTWTNDADHVCIDLLSDQQAQAAASLISLSGGNLMSGDRLTAMNTNKLEILKKVFPATGINAKPVDLFDTDPQTVFAAPVHKSFDQWTVAGFFNPELSNPIVKKYPLHRLWLKPNVSYLVYDFWNERFLGEIKDSIAMQIDPGSVQLVSIREKKGIPQFLSTTRHVMQGIVEIEEIHFDSTQNTLSGISLGPEGSVHDVIIYLPETYYWMPSQTKLFDTSPNYTMKMVDQGILRIRLQFLESTKISWKIALHKVESEKTK
jgi:hypothetical protein